MLACLEFAPPTPLARPPTAATARPALPGGCRHNSSATEPPKCPDSLPVCNTETHHCQAKPGSTLLTTIVFSSQDCQGCTREGVNMSLAGSDIVVPQPRCRTVDLDHPGRDDFSYRSTFSTSQSEEIFMGWENCWNVSM